MIDMKFLKKKPRTEPTLSAPETIDGLPLSQDVADTKSSRRERRKSERRKSDRRRSPKVIFVSKVSDLDGVSDFKGQVILHGASVGLAPFIPGPGGTAPKEPGSRYLAQPARRAQPGLPFVPPRPTECQIHVFLEKTVVEALESIPKASVYLAVDQYLQYGRRKSFSGVIITGGFGPASDPSTVDVLSFRHGKLQAASQRNMSSRDKATYQEDLEALALGELAHDFNAGLKVHIAHSLDPGRSLSSDRFEHLPASLVDKPSRFPLVLGEPRPSPISLAPGVAVVSLASLGACAYLGSMYLELQGHRTAFDREVASVKDVYYSGDASVKLLSAKQSFIEKERPQDAAVSKIERFLAAVSQIEGAFLEDLYLVVDQDAVKTNRFASNSEPPEFRAVLSVIANPEIAVVEQGKPILRELANSSGATLAVVDRKSVTLTEDRKSLPLRRLIIEGRFVENEGLSS